MPNGQWCLLRALTSAAPGGGEPAEQDPRNLSPLAPYRSEPFAVILS